MQHIATVLDHGFEYIGGNVAADLANTTSNRYEGDRHEHIQTYADLVEFARLADLIRPALSRRLISAAERHPEKATQVYRRTVALREAVWAAFSRLASGREPSMDDVTVISAEAADAMAHARVAKTGD